MLLKYKNLFTFGCSFTKDNYQPTWANYVAESYNLKLHNFAERGAGADFLIRRLLVTPIDPKTDIVIIMWPSADRLDLWGDATTPHLVEDYVHASWADGISPTLIDYYGKYSQTHGFNLNGSVPRGYKNYYYKYFYSAHSAVHSWLVNIITAQLYLKSKKIKHVMMSTFPLMNPLHYHHDSFQLVPEIFQQIDQSVFVTDSSTVGFFHFCKEQNLPFFDSHHPDYQSHCIYVDNLLKFKIDELFK